MRLLCSLFAALLLLAPAAAADRADKLLDRFELWAKCAPMNLIVEGLSDRAADIGLTQDSVVMAVRSRLRAEGLYDADAKPYLYVNVNVGEEFFSTRIEYNKWLFDPVAKSRGFAPTWDEGGAGTHDGDGEYILSWLATYTDDFVAEYRRVNKAACKN